MLSVPHRVHYGALLTFLSQAADRTASRVQTPRFCHNAAASPKERMNPTAPNRSRAAKVLTDIHFWVPALVLLGGLLLLKFLH